MTIFFHVFVVILISLVPLYDPFESRKTRSWVFPATELTGVYLYVVQGSNENADVANLH